MSKCIKSRRRKATPWTITRTWDYTRFEYYPSAAYSRFYFRGAITKIAMSRAPRLSEPIRRTKAQTVCRSRVSVLKRPRKRLINRRTLVRASAGGVKSRTFLKTREFLRFNVAAVTERGTNTLQRLRGHDQEITIRPRNQYTIRLKKLQKRPTDTVSQSGFWKCSESRWTTNGW